MSARYITTTLPYVNADPHLGFALEIVKADIVARWYELNGDEVFFNTGTDEHGQKILQKAESEGRSPQEYVDEYAAKFKTLKTELNLSPDLHFIRTTDAHHVSAAQAFWRRCTANGDIYKKAYQVKYCIGCELEKTDSELIDGRCPLHPTSELERIAEENYFFRFSKYQQPLLELYAAHPDFVLPDFRQNEIRLFIERGLQDFSISRLKEKMSWGIEVPDDPMQVMYVWFDALVNYISTLGWPEEEADFVKFWGTREQPNAVQIAGKDNLRQQSAMWQAMLMSAGLPRSKQVVVQGFVTSGGQKMSKSLGNVVNPLDLTRVYGADVLRYYLARHMSSFEDSDFTEVHFREAYTANLTNGLGNLVARVMKLAETHLPEPACGEPVESVVPVESAYPQEYREAINAFEFNRAMDLIWAKVGALDERITSEKPFAVVKEDEEKGRAMIAALVLELYEVGMLLAPFMPATSEEIKKAVLENKKPENLFPRLP